jgi:hypothetical protein
MKLYQLLFQKSGYNRVDRLLWEERFCVGGGGVIYLQMRLAHPGFYSQRKTEPL